MSVNETTAWTAEEVWGHAGLAGGRISIAQNELRRRLELQLPDVLDYFNGQLNLSGVGAIPIPTGYFLAPQQLNDSFINTVLVGAEVQREASGTQRFRNRAVMTIYIINERIVSGEQVGHAWDVADVVATLLLQYLGGCVDAAGRQVWRQLAPIDQKMLPEDWSDYSGVMLNYSLMQDPSDLLWA